MKSFVRRPLWAGTVAGVLGLALQGCNPTAAPPAVSAPVQAVNPHDEAARLIKTLDLSSHQQVSPAITLPRRSPVASHPNRPWSGGSWSSGTEAR